MTPSSPDKDDCLVALGQAIRALRLEREITQEDLALRVGVHPTYISMIEAGRRNVSWGTVKRISRALNVRLVDLARLADEIEGRRSR